MSLDPDSRMRNLEDSIKNAEAKLIPSAQPVDDVELTKLVYNHLSEVAHIGQNPLTDRHIVELMDYISQSYQSGYAAAVGDAVAKEKHDDN